jgi:hypothetical protein
MVLLTFGRFYRLIFNEARRFGAASASVFGQRKALNLVYALDRAVQ